MILSFDLDDTLITRIHNWNFEPEIPGFRIDSEYLRLGTVELFRWIRTQNHQIYLYTNSYRGFKNLSDWFFECGIPVDKVINQVVHDEMRMKKGAGIRTQKVPLWFEIDMHFDDLDELADEERIYQVLPNDEYWVETVKKFVADKIN